VNFAESPESVAKAVNQWVSERTSGKITQLLDPLGVRGETRLLLASTLYFNASWAVPFDVSETQPRPFHALDGAQHPVWTMHRVGTYRLADADGFQVLELPYFGDRLSLLVILPAAGQFAELRQRWSPASIEAALRASTPEAVEVLVPKFHFNWGPRSLRTALQSAGVRQAFTAEADFSGIDATGKLGLDDVVQSTDCAVTELGTEAAAASAALVVAASAAPRQFIADRPFFVLVRDASGLFPFLGQVSEPDRAD